MLERPEKAVRVDVLSHARVTVDHQLDRLEKGRNRRLLGGGTVLVTTVGLMMYARRRKG